MADLPTSTLTLLVTDIEGSTRLWGEHPDDLRAAVGQQRASAGRTARPA